MNGGLLMAQVLKEDVRDRIRLAAIEEFKESGYIKASMRSIASKADISVGNLYRYYSDKHSMFESIVSPIYENLHKKVAFDFKMLLLDINLLEYIDLINKVFSSQRNHRDELYILMEKSRGSKYEDFKSILFQKVENTIQEIVVAEVNKEQEVIKGDLFAKALARSLVEGLAIITTEAEDDAYFVQNVIQYIEMTFKSTVRTMIAIRDGKINFRRLSDEEIYNRINHTCNN